MIRSFSLGLLFLTQLAFTIGALADGQELTTGFYKVQSKSSRKSKLGPIIYLHSDEFFISPSEKENRQGPMIFGLRGVFSDSGEIWTEYAAGQVGQAQNRWRTKGMRLRPGSSADGLMDLTKLQDETYHLNLYNKDGSKLVESDGLIFIGRTESDLARYSDAKGLDGFDPKKTVYVAHRGSPFTRTGNQQGIYPANTIEAFEAAFINGYQGIELDIHVTTDGNVVISHDNDLSVSSTCTGLITEKALAELADCRVLRSGLTPESGFASSQAKISSRLPLLSEVLKKFLPDERTQALFVDVKPDEVDKLAKGIDRSLEGIDPRFYSKIIFLVRTDDLTKQLKDDGVSGSHYALEGPTGWEPLESPGKEQFLLDDVRGESKESFHDSVSLSLGLGLGLNGAGRGFLPTVQALWQVFKAVPKIVKHLDIDIGYLGWSAANFKKYQTFLEKAHDRKLQVIGWTVNTVSKMKELREKTPRLDYVLSDLPFDAIARLQIRDYLKSLKVQAGPSQTRP